MADINNTLSAAWGSGYVNDFIDRGRIKRVFIQGDDRLAHAAAGFQQVVRAQQPRPDGPLLRLRHRLVDLRFAQAGALQRRSLGRNSRACPPRAKAPARPWRRWRSWRRNCRTGIAYEWTALSYRGKARRLAGRLALRHLAGGRLSLPGRALRKLVDSVRGHAGGAARHFRRDPGHACGAAWPTTSFSRSACSPPSVSRPRTRF